MTRRADLPDVLEGHYTRGGKPLTHLAYKTPGPAPYTARLTLREACQARGLSVYQVAMSGHSQGTVDPGTVYRLARGNNSRVDLDTLATLAGIIHTLSGRPVGVSELLALEVSGEKK